MNKETKTKIRILKFDELDKDQKEKEKIINNLKGVFSYLSEKLDIMEESIHAQQQYSRRNCLLLHGIEETKDEDAGNNVVEVLNHLSANFKKMVKHTQTNCRQIV